MTETAATYETAGAATAEPLPECETGSAERMLEAAIRWNLSIAGDMVFDMAPHDVRLLRDRQDSQTRLLRNILAKIREEPPPDPRTDPFFGARGWGKSSYCPDCGALVRVTLEFSKTTHG